MLDTLFSTIGSTAETNLTLGNLLLALLTAFASGLLISLVYLKTHRERQPSTSFALTMVILPAVISVIILLVGSNVARAFSLAGAFSIIRFRSVPGDPKDIAYVLLSLAVGLACGMGYLGYAVLLALVVGVMLLLLDTLKFGQTKMTGKLLKVIIPENLDFEHVLEDSLNRYTASHTLLKVKSADLGSVYELVYQITMLPGAQEKDMIDELRCRNGNLNITLVLSAQSGESVG